MFRAVSGFGEIGIRALLQGMLVAMRKLATHGVVAGLQAVIGFVGTFPAVGIIEKMIAGVVGHEALPEQRKFDNTL